MKKVICLVLLATMLFCCSAYAEEKFTLHSGTTFGMSAQEVADTEAANGFEFDVSVFSDSGMAHGIGRVANFDGTGITYRFSAEDQLIDLQYKFYHGDGNFVPDSEYPDWVTKYESIETGLIAKYGETQYCSKTGFAFPKVGKFGDFLENEYPFFGGMDLRGTSSEHRAIRREYSHRLIELEDGSCVLIDHVLYEQRYTKKTGSLYKHQLRYKLLTDEETQKIRQSMTSFMDDL